MKNLTEQSRIVYFDYLRIAATVAVIVLHVSSQNWYSIGVETDEWKLLNFYDSLVRWAVPVFVMISGALFLEGKQPIAQIYKKNILRIVTAFYFWSFLYAVVGTKYSGFELKRMVRSVFTGHYHMWFLFMIIGVYMLIPFLRKITETMGLTKYFLVLSLVFTFVLPQANLFLSYKSEVLGFDTNEIFDKFKFHFTLGYACYFVCGYYLNKVDIKKKMCWCIYLLGIVGAVMTIVLTYAASIIEQEAVGVFYDNFSINVMLMSVAVFVYAKNRLNSLQVGVRMQKIVRKMSKYSFGVYLVHVMVLEGLNRVFHLNTLSFNPLVSVPVISVIILVVSYIISAILNRVPVLSKYVV